MTEYVTREDILAIGATQLTDEFDDAAPPIYVVPSDISRIVQIIVAVTIEDAAADDIATAAIQFRGGAISGQPTISLAAGGTGNTGTPLGTDTALPAIVMTVDIPLKQGLPLQIFGLLAGDAGTIGNMAATVVLQ